MEARGSLVIRRPLPRATGEGEAGDGPFMPRPDAESPNNLIYLHNVSPLVRSEFAELIGKQHTLRTLFALRTAGPQRFGQLEAALDVNPAQLDRALKWLQEHVYVLAKTVPGRRGSIAVDYDLSARGRAFLEAFDTFLEGADRRRDILGDKAVAELEALAG